jgi:PAS domain S-box-containing protein
MGWELNGLAERLVTETREAIFALSADAEILAWSRGAEALVGYDASECLGRSLVELANHDDDKQSFETALRQAVDGKGADVSVACTWRTRKGTFVEVEIWLRWTRMSESSGFVVANARDASLLRMAQAQVLEIEAGSALELSRGSQQLRREAGRLRPVCRDGPADGRLLAALEPPGARLSGGEPRAVDAAQSRRRPPSAAMAASQFLPSNCRAGSSRQASSSRQRALTSILSGSERGV